MSNVYGADPELVILDPESNPVPAHLFFPPKTGKLDMAGPGFVYRDGYMVELNPYPSHCRALLGYNVRYLMQQSRALLPRGYRLAPLPAVKIDLRQLLDAPSDVQQFGCEPAMNAYTGTWHHPGLDGSVHPWRYAGGHMHYSGMGIKQIASDPELANLYVKMLDLWAGIPLAVMFPDEAHYQRRKFYGLAGEYRIQKYPKIVNYTYDDKGSSTPVWGEKLGIEYRSPGPEIWNSMEPAGLVHGVMTRIARLFDDFRNSWDPMLEPVVQSALNTGYPDPKTLLSPFKGFYGAETILACAGAFSTFALIDTDHDLHTGWGDYANKLGYPAIR